MAAVSLTVAKLASEALALSNTAVAADSVLSGALSGARHAWLQVGGPAGQRFPVTLTGDASVSPQELQTSAPQRKWAGLPLGEKITLQPLTLSKGLYAKAVQVEIDLLVKGAKMEAPIDAEQLSAFIRQRHLDHVLSVNQVLVHEFQGYRLQTKVLKFELFSSEELAAMRVPIPNEYKDAVMCFVASNTIIGYTRPGDSAVKLKNLPGGANMNAPIAPDFNFAELGIGGLDNEFQTIFRRAFASRVLPIEIFREFGVRHVKGVLLFGPPGTGKTLMARQIGRMLRSREPKIVNGPEILNKYVGQSEENIRNLFAEAEAEYKAKKDESQLHIIIFDELDAICKQRGSRNDGTGVGDSVVNQLLAKMDGVDQLNNILIIGMTNRKDMIDEALLRPGRLEVHVEISLPDEAGRLQIINIHTTTARKNNRLGPDVDLARIAALTKNFSGAEIEGLVNSATSHAVNRHIDTLKGVKTRDSIKDAKIAQADFERALQDITPAFGTSENAFEGFPDKDIIMYSEHVQEIINDGELYIKQVQQSQFSPMAAVLLHGPPNSGKTALAALLARASQYPFIRLISPETLVGYTELAKCAAINKVFEDSYKSRLSVIVVDAIERLLDWSPIGSRFSNLVLQTMFVLLKKRPPKNHRLLVICTTSQREVLRQMELLDSFDGQINVPLMSTVDQVSAVVRERKLFAEPEVEKSTLELLSTSTGGRLSPGIGIKRLLTVIELARQDSQGHTKFVSSLLSAMER